MRLPIVDDSSLETMLEVPSYHSSINSVELYLEAKPVSHRSTTLSNHETRKRSRPNDANLDANPREIDFLYSWLIECELYVGMHFRNQEELEKAVKLYSDRRHENYSDTEVHILVSQQMWALVFLHERSSD
ncbi:unnamed protein product [Brassica rapa]|uniref:Uncharacterized protein n=1 Tax=Brassica campestris TaxID=3711 RepID=A0A8D9HD58_BRACM|nr:unnamed protein product [Brassica rapa]